MSMQVTWLTVVEEVVQVIVYRSECQFFYSTLGKQTLVKITSTQAKIWALYSVIESGVCGIIFKDSGRQIKLPYVILKDQNKPVIDLTTELVGRIKRLYYSESWWSKLESKLIKA
jgi:hypothetical protein